MPDGRQIAYVMLVPSDAPRLGRTPSRPEVAQPAEPLQQRYWFGAMPWEGQATYWRRSPHSLVGHVKTPARVIVGTEDQRTLPSEAEQL